MSRLQLTLLLGVVVLAGCAPDTPSSSLSEVELLVAQCKACHGTDGRSLIDGYPHLAGQNETYMLRQLYAFRDGTRINPQMQLTVRDMSNDELRALAAYFAAMPAQPVE